MRRSLILTTTGVALAASLTAGVGHADAQGAGGDTASSPSRAAAPAAPAKLVPTHFAFGAAGYGSRMTGGSLPTASKGTAYQVIGCTNLAGKTKDNYVNEETLPGLGVVHGIRTDLTTVKKGGYVASVSEHRIARVELLKTPLGSLDITGIDSVATASHNAKFGGTFTSTIASITYTPTSGKPVSIKIPTLNKSITIPGLVTISLPQSQKQITNVKSRVRGAALDIHVIPTKTDVKIGFATAILRSGLRKGLFRGYSAGVQAGALQDNARIGRTPLSLMPCVGTRGKVQSSDVAKVNAAKQVVAHGVGSAQLGVNKIAVAHGTESGTVAHASLLNGQIAVKAVTAVASVRKTAHGVQVSSKGTNVLDVEIAGKHYDLTKLSHLKIPGLAEIQSDVEQKMPHGIRVIGLQIKVLDGSGATINLGVAQLQILRPTQ